MHYLRSVSSPSSLPLQLALVSFLVNFAGDTSSIFLPLYARDLGASNLDVGLIAASSGMAFLVSSFVFGRQSDISGRVGFIRFGVGLVAVAYLLQIVAPSPLALLGVRAFVGFCSGVFSVALMAYAYEAGERVGKFASYSPLGSLLGILAAAAIRDYNALFVASAAASAIAFAISLKLKEESQSHIKVAIFPTSVIWANRRIYLPFFLRHTGANAIWAIFPLFLVSIGATKMWIAIINGINVGGQFLAMRFMDRFRARRMFTIGLVLSTLVFAIYGIANHYLQLIPVQMVLAVAWSCLYVGALIFLMKQNVERGTAVGMLYSTTQLSAGVGPLLGGAISQVWGFPTVMYVASALSFGGLLAFRGVELAKPLRKNNR